MRSDQALCLAAVANRMPNCRNPAAESRIRDVATAPHCGDEVVFTDHAFAVADEKLEDIEYLRLHCDEMGSASQLPSWSVE